MTTQSINSAEVLLNVEGLNERKWLRAEGKQHILGPSRASLQSPAC